MPAEQTFPSVFDTRTASTHVGHQFGTSVVQVVVEIDTEARPELLRALLADTLNSFGEQGSGQEHTLHVPVLLHRPAKQDHILYLPGSHAHLMLQAWAKALARLAELHPLPSRHLTCCVGLHELRKALNDSLPAAPRGEVFDGPLGCSERQEMTVRSSTGREFAAPLYTRLDIDEHPALFTAFLDGSLNLVDTPFAATQQSSPEIPLILHKPAARRFVLYVPSALADRLELELLAVARQLEALAQGVPRYVAMFDLATRPADVRALLGPPDHPEHVGGHLLTADEPIDLAPRDEDPTLHVGLVPLARIHGPRGHGRQAAALSLLSAVPERFPGPRGANVWVLEGQDGPRLAWRLSAHEIDLWRAKPIRLLVQMHNLDVFPIVAIVLARLSALGEVEADLFQCFDASDQDHRTILDTLTEAFGVYAALYAPAGELVDVASFSGPFEDNVAQILKLADERFARDTNLDYADAVTRFGSTAYPRVGAMRHPFLASTFQNLRDAAATAVAVGIVDFWSQGPNLRYLLFNQCYSAARYTAVRARVLDAAVYFGVRLPPNLRALAIERELAPDVEALLERQLVHFADVHLGLRPSGLDALARWENWRALLEDAEDYMVAVEQALVDLASDALAAADMHHGDE